jgi:hypothetical protein
VGLAYVLQLLSLNGQAAAYFGGMIQIIGLTIADLPAGFAFQSAHFFGPAAQARTPIIPRSSPK